MKRIAHTEMLNQPSKHLEFAIRFGIILPRDQLRLEVQLFVIVALPKIWINFSYFNFPMDFNNLVQLSSV